MTRARPAVGGRWLWACAVLALGLSGCSRATSSTPRRLRDGYVELLPEPGAEAAYALLTPEVQSETSFEAFATRWAQNEAERTAMASAARSVPERDVVGLRAGVTAHDGGRTLTWVELDGAYYVLDGLPGTRPSATPALTIQSFLAATRAVDFGAVQALLSDDLAEALAQDWQARAASIEEALNRPDAIELSEDRGQAVLRYATGKALTLSQTPTGWRITALE